MIKPTPKPVDNRKIAMTVAQDDDTGDVFLWEHDLAEGKDTKVATFHAESRTVTVKGQFGPELAMRDVAQIRAMIFAQLFEKLVNEGTVDLG